MGSLRVCFIIFVYAIISTFSWLVASLDKSNFTVLAFEFN